MSDDLVSALSGFGIGLSRLIRYTYGGILLLVFAVLFHRDKMAAYISALTPLVVVLVTVVIGAGIYVLHRSTVIAVLSLVLTIFFDWHCRKTSVDASMNPTTYLKKFVEGGAATRRLAYVTVRHGGFFSDEDRLDVIHAETGMLVMTFVGLVLASCYGCFFVALDRPYVFLMLFAAAVFLIGAIVKDCTDHSIECVVLKAEGSDQRLASILKKAGFTLTPAGVQLAAIAVEREGQHPVL
jgi:hypothetical protein